MHDDAYIGERSENNIKCIVHDDLGWKSQTTWYILPRHWLYEWFSQFHSCGTYSVLSRTHSIEFLQFIWWMLNSTKHLTVLCQWTLAMNMLVDCYHVDIHYSHLFLFFTFDGPVSPEIIPGQSSSPEVLQRTFGHFWCKFLEAGCTSLPTQQRQSTAFTIFNHQFISWCWCYLD